MAQLLKELQPLNLLPSLVAGLVISVVSISFSSAFAMLIFSGEISEFLPDGLGFLLFGQFVATLVMMLVSSVRWAVPLLQNSPIAILALASSAIIANMTGSTSQVKFLTVAAVIGLATILTGISFWVIGQLKLGNLVRYIPYPVIGGFLAGSGLILVIGGISVMTGTSINLLDFSWLVKQDLLIKFIPGLGFALLMLLIMRRSDHFLTVPIILISAVAIFYLILWLTNTSIPAAVSQGWLSGWFHEAGGSLWNPIGIGDLKFIDWSAIGSEVGNLITIIPVSVLALLLCITGIEVATGEEIDLNQELKATGISNVVAGLGGSSVSYHAIGNSVLAHKLGARSRLVGVFLAVICVVVIFFRGSLLSFFPSVILGGLLAFVGMDILNTWVLDGWSKMLRVDYAIVISIMLIINLFGFLQGVGFGVVVAVLMFVVRYSRISPIRHELSGRVYRSTVTRPALYQQLLRRQGDWCYILKLQGFIFFGASNELLDAVKERLQDPDQPALKYVVLDMEMVTGLDSSTVFSFEKLQKLAVKEDFTMIFTDLHPDIQRRMKVVFEGDGERVCRIFPDLDHGVEWCENQMINTFKSIGLGTKPETLIEQLVKGLSLPENVSRLMQYLDRQEVEEGTYIIRYGDPPRGMYFVERGQVTVQIEHEGKTLRIEKMGTGTVFGELGFYLGTKATANVVADQASSLYYLSITKLQEMEAHDPDISNQLHKFMVGLLSERVRRNARLMEAMVD